MKTGSDTLSDAAARIEGDAVYVELQYDRVGQISYVPRSRFDHDKYRTSNLLCHNTWASKEPFHVIRVQQKLLKLLPCGAQNPT